MKSVKVDISWLVELTEDEWYGSSENHDQLVRQSREQATVALCTQLTLVVVPDPIFPLYGNTKRHIVHTETIGVGGAKKFQISTAYKATLDTAEWENLSEKGRQTLLSTTRDALNERGLVCPGRYTIELQAGAGTGARVLETGRV